MLCTPYLFSKTHKQPIVKQSIGWPILVAYVSKKKTLFPKDGLIQVTVL